MSYFFYVNVYHGVNTNDSDGAEERTKCAPFRDYRRLYFWINTVAVGFHIANVLGILIANEVHLRHILKGYVFVSPSADLHWTNHALVRVDALDNRCPDVTMSPNFLMTRSSVVGLPGNVFPPRRPYPDFMRLFNFSGTDVVSYRKPGYELSINTMMLCFCLLSAVFQTVHGYLLDRFEKLPRVLHYLEYSFSSPLMVMVMAVNVGILELFLIVCLGVIFFGMNSLGACAEVLSHYAGHVAREHLPLYAWLCWAAHICGWVLFIFAMTPIWAQFHEVMRCSENSGVPDYAYAMVVVESLLFFSFGALQVAGLVEKMSYVWRIRGLGDAQFGLPVDMLFKYDCAHAVLSLVAKTMLVWILLGPALSVDYSLLTPRT